MAQRVLLISLLLVLVSGVVAAQPKAVVTYTRTEERADASTWQLELRLFARQRVAFSEKRTKSPEGRYTMAKDKDDFWDLQEEKALNAAVTSFDKVKPPKAKASKATVFSVTCIQRADGPRRCVRHDEGAAPTAETKALDKIVLAFTNGLELSEL